VNVHFCGIFENIAFTCCDGGHDAVCLMMLLLSDIIANADISHSLVDLLAGRGAFLSSAVLHMCTWSNDGKYWSDVSSLTTVL